MKRGVNKIDPTNKSRVYFWYYERLMGSDQLEPTFVFAIRCHSLTWATALFTKAFSLRTNI